MSRTPRHSVQDRIVNAFLAALADLEPGVITASLVCHRAGVNRSSFYQYFEDTDDLEARSLPLYYLRTVGPTFAPATLEELALHYLRCVDAMRAAPEFFSAIKTQARLVHYSDRWKSLIEGGLRDYFQRPEYLDDGQLWNLHLEFALATVHRFCDLGFRGTTGYDLPTLCRWMIEFQIGGLVRLGDLNDRGLEPLTPGVDALLARRRRHAEQPKAHPRRGT